MDRIIYTFKLKTMSWKYVFNSSLKHWGHITICRQHVKASGYDYYIWNGWVYSVTSEKRTEYLETDLF